MEQMAHDAVAVLDHAGVETTHVMGASMGGVIAQVLGVEHRDRVRSLVLACTALVPAGFASAAPFARTKRREIVMAMIATPAALAAILAIVFQHRVGTSATFAQFKHGFDTEPVARTALGRAILVAVAITTGAALWGVRLLRSPSAPKPKIDGSKRWR